MTAGETSRAMNDFTLVRTAAGRLAFAGPTGEEHHGIVPVRAFPISSPDESISLVTSDGHELAWIDRLADVPDDIRSLIEEELAARDFVPEIRRIRAVSSFATPSTWTVDTDRGETTFVLRGEDDIRRMSQAMLLVEDSNGVQYLIRDRQTLDRASRRLLDRFL